mmetsp:Transcript_27376/g.69653  ORF Transcript_27376/g.69653 Transcript_27376/m.69653 type:complete len:537 (+) Transcript_27376:34-1644(+)
MPLSEGWEEQEEWFYVLNKQQQGPATLAELGELFARGKSGGGISSDTLVWCSALVEWTRVRELSSLVALLQQQPSSASLLAPTPIPSFPDIPKPYPTEAQHVAQPAAVAPARFAAASSNPIVASIGTPCCSQTRYSCATGSGGVGGGALSGHPIAGSAPAPHATLPASQPSGTDGSSSKKHSAIRTFLRGWLPQRSAPKELVRRGILKNDPLGGALSSPSGVTAPAARDEDVFGGKLAVQLSRSDTTNGIPLIVNLLMAKLRSKGIEGLRTEGIFRVPGDSSEMKHLRMQINQGADPQQLMDRCDNVHSAAGLLKMYFRELQPPLLSFGLYGEFIRCSAQIGPPSPSADVRELMGLLQRLPAGHYDLLQHLISFLREVVSYSSESKMTVGNTAAVFAPNLLRAEVDSIENLADTVHVVNLIAVLMTCYSGIFGVPETAPAAPNHQASSGSMLDRMSVTSSAGATPMLSADSTASLAEPRWFYLNAEHEQQGPVDWPALQALFQQTRITSSTFIFSDGMSDWKAVTDVGDINGAEPC